MYAYCENNPANTYDPTGCRFVRDDRITYGDGTVEYTDSGTGHATVYNAGNEVSVTVDNDLVILDVYLLIEGAIPAQYLADSMRANWEGSYVIYGMEKEVKVNLHNGYSPNGKTIYVNTYNTNGRSNTVSTFRGAESTVVNIYTRYENGSGKDAGWSMAHELGHCFGIEDYYTHVDNREPGFSRSYPSIMNYGFHHACAQDVIMVISALESGKWQLWGG